MDKKCIFISADHGLAVIYFLQSDLVQTLLEAGHEVVILTDDALVEGIQQRFSSPGLIVEGLRLKKANQYAAQTGLQLAGAITSGSPQLMGLLGVGAQVGVLLPFSRTQESEADKLGLDLMARAGFDPRQSVPLWENMARAGGAGQPEFLSTHPSHATRIQELSARIPQVLPAYEGARAAGRRPACS